MKTKKTSVPADRPQGDDSKNVIRKRLILTSAIVLALFALGAAGLNKSGTGQESPEAEETPEVQNGASIGATIPANWLPNLRVPEGAPETRVDLVGTARQFCEQNYFGDDVVVTPDQLEWTIKLPEGGIGSVADVELDGDALKVRWKEDAIGKTKVLLEASVKGSEGSQVAHVSFNIESWAPDYLKMAVTILGGLGLFLLGMKFMSDGLTSIAGSRLRRLISWFTSNRFMGVLVGIVATVAVQSSSAISVMTLGFVNSGLMTLRQAMGVIIGANIGTTFTGWILVINITALGLPILGVAALVLVFFSKTERVRNYAMFALGFGMIFFGLETLKDGMSPLSDVPEFTALMQSVQANTFANAGKCILIGTLITALIQSSAATFAIVITLGAIGSIDLNSGAAIVLGSNIGTTITALLAAIGANSRARQVAYFHTFFNIVGVLWVWAVFFNFFMPLVNDIGDSLGMVTVSGKIAVTHTLFNTANMVVFLPLVGPLSRMFERFVKDDKGKPRKTESITGLDQFVTREPVIGIERSRKEVHRMFLDCLWLGECIKELRKVDFDDSPLVEEAFTMERKLDVVQSETVDFISRLSVRSFSSDLAASAREQVRLAEELESISDYLTDLLKSNLKLKNEELELPETMKEKSNEFLADVLKTLGWLEKNFQQRKHTHLVSIISTWRNDFVGRIKETRDLFIHTMFDEKNDPRVIVSVNHQLNVWRRIYEHLLNIAEAMELPGVHK